MTCFVVWWVTDMFRGLMSYWHVSLFDELLTCIVVWWVTDMFRGLMCYWHVWWVTYWHVWWCSELLEAWENALQTILCGREVPAPSVAYWSPSQGTAGWNSTKWEIRQTITFYLDSACNEHFLFATCNSCQTGRWDVIEAQRKAVDGKGWTYYCFKAKCPRVLTIQNGTVASLNLVS